MELNEAKQIIAKMSTAAAPILKELERLQNIERAYKTWQEKTEWIQTRNEWPFETIGKHRADIIKELVEYYECLLENEAQ
jgi:hypothetical protein